MTCDATFSDDRRHRYVLWRIWEKDKPVVNFIGLNPSTADESKDDPTMRRCANFAKSWGFGGFYMTNLFGYRSTRPDGLKTATDPVGCDNNKWIIEIAKKAELVIFAWGTHGSFLNRDREVVSFIADAKCLGVTQNGHPKHPLYLKSNTILQEYPYFL